MTRTQRIVLAAIAAATTLAGVLRYAATPGVVPFVAAAAALAGLAWLVSFGTEQVGARYGPGVTGFLQSTLGNLPEFFIVIFALSAGETVVAQTSIIGSLFANALLVLGLVIVVGARSAEGSFMRFKTRLPTDTATLLLVSIFIIVITGLSVGSSDRASAHIKTIDAIGAGCILVVYAAWAWSYLRSDEQPAAEGHGATMPLGLALGLLGAAGVGSAFVSDWFIHALDPAIKSLGISKAFAGLVIVAIAGNAVENFTGIVLARKRNFDLAISVVKNSVAQIAAFLFPALVLVSLGFSHTLTFQLAPVYIGALFFTAIAIWQITGDGEAQEFEGWALIALYVILATFALYE
ncbi:MAG: Ca2+:H+ antiporter [Thermoleophilaceae bacterium]|jgi:Ca2+:H+ antiporter|nr:Ca2+:H+ antiporter [Thermoleophilaceae bacterium]MEA2367947.1 Ca2+:H+ antiporter [Thermoleophilaceae bacterium]MEA2388837.1 Ca2+:H+ antiporter [Thermoleophilaceae bacterium]